MPIGGAGAPRLAAPNTFVGATARPRTNERSLRGACKVGGVTADIYTGICCTLLALSITLTDPALALSWLTGPCALTGAVLDFRRRLLNVFWAGGFVLLGAPSTPKRGNSPTVSCQWAPLQAELRS